MSVLVSVLMPCYRDFQLVERSLPRIIEGSRCDLELVLLNNDSGQVEDMRNFVGRLGDSRVRLLELEDKAGFVKAINAGIGTTTGELVFFANSDLFVANGYLDEMVSFFERSPRAACATGKILRYEIADDRETDIIDTTGHVIGRNRRVADRGENQKDVGQYDHEQEVFGVSGAALVARREALESARVRGEYLDESFYMYKDDIDLCWRLRLAGWECWYLPTAVAYHVRSSKGLGPRSYFSAMRRFHDNEQTKPIDVRMNSMKNHWLILVKNDDLTNFVRDLPYILGREALLFSHNLAFAPRETLTTLWRFSRALPRAVSKRREIKARQIVSASEIRSWFLSESHPS